MRLTAIACAGAAHGARLSSSVAVANQAVSWAKAVGGEIAHAAEQGNKLLHALSLLQDESSPFHRAKMQWAGAGAQAL